MEYLMRKDKAHYRQTSSMTHVAAIGEIRSV